MSKQGFPNRRVPPNLIPPDIAQQMAQNSQLIGGRIINPIIVKCPKCGNTKIMIVGMAGEMHLVSKSDPGGQFVPYGAIFLCYKCKEYFNSEDGLKEETAPPATATAEEEKKQ